MSSDEDDYMSDKFLNTSDTKTDAKLYKSRKLQHEIQLSAKRTKFEKDKPKSISVLQKERLEEGLSNCLSSDNKGFALLNKMGFKPGQSLGKNSTGGITEPITLNIKSDRQGLGRETAIRQLKEQRDKIRNQRVISKSNNESTSIEEFRKRMINKSEERQVEIELGKCQRACEKLDANDDVDVPLLEWFWPLRKPEKTTESDEDEEPSDDEEDEDEINKIEYTTQEKLDMVKSYMRTSYNYCNWCGVKYENENDMQQNCPGNDKDDH